MVGVLEEVRMTFSDLSSEITSTLAGISGFF